jgi:uncharacterized protein YecA (UPF0149 family)
MIQIPESTAKEIVRMLNNYVEELCNSLEVQDNSDEISKYIEGEIANTESMIDYFQNKVQATV